MKIRASIVIKWNFWLIDDEAFDVIRNRNIQFSFEVWIINLNSSKTMFVSSCKSCIMNSGCSSVTLKISIKVLFSNSGHQVDASFQSEFVAEFPIWTYINSWRIVFYVLCSRRILLTKATKLAWKHEKRLKIGTSFNWPILKILWFRNIFSSHTNQHADNRDTLKNNKTIQIGDSKAVNLESLVNNCIEIQRSHFCLSCSYKLNWIDMLWKISHCNTFPFFLFLYCSLAAAAKKPEGFFIRF